MKRFLTLCALVIVFLINGCTTIEPNETIHVAKDAPVYSRTQPVAGGLYLSMVRLTDPTTARTFCSGTVISKDFVITAAHCLGEKGRTTPINVIGETNMGVKSSPFVAKAIAFDRAADFAIIQGDFALFNKTLVLDQPHLFLTIQPPLLTCGFPHNSTGTCYPTGAVLETYYHLASVDGRLFPGMSGGPVIDVNSGLLVAVNSANGSGFIVVAPLVGIFEDLGIVVTK